MYTITRMELRKTSPSNGEWEFSSSERNPTTKLKKHCEYSCYAFELKPSLKVEMAFDDIVSCYFAASSCFCFSRIQWIMKSSVDIPAW